MRAILFKIGCLGFLLCGALLSAQDSYGYKIYEGNKYFHKGDFNKASVSYLQAIKIKPNSFEGHYNLGNALYKKNLFSEAKTEFDRAHQLAKTDKEKKLALRSTGNVLMKMKQTDKASGFYKKTLKVDAKDEIAQKNYQISVKQKDKNDQQDSKNKKQNQPNKNPENQQRNSIKNQAPKVSKKEEKEWLEKMEREEKEAARKMLDRKSRTMSKNNEKDW